MTREMKRVLVIGSGGAGKSSFAVQLAEHTGLPLIHLDAEFWKPGWVETPKDEWAAKVEKLVSQERWIMDGNFGGTMERRIAACDTVVFLDISRWVCLWRVIARRVRHHGRARPDMTPGCNEKLDGIFLWWILTYPGQRRRWILRRLTTLRPDQRAVVLDGTRAIDTFLRSVATESTV